MIEPYPQDAVAMVCMSGGKDSTATLLQAIEWDAPNIAAVFADTGNEHELTYEFVDYIEEKTGIKVTRVKADFSEKMEARRLLLLKIASGEAVDPRPKSRYVWDRETAARAAEIMRPTGIPFLDLCVLKGMFPTRLRSFCSQLLKHEPMFYDFVDPILEAGRQVVSWQGVRADESRTRAKLDEWEEVGGGLFNYRPILKWAAEDVFAMHKKHGIKPNPLYKMGMGRVGCMPCINCRKDELRQISNRCPDHIYKIETWEEKVSAAAKSGNATFFHATKSGRDHETDGPQTIRDVVAWSNTSRGGKVFDLVNQIEKDNDPKMCSSLYGLCE